MQQQRRRVMESYNYKYYSHVLRTELLRESEALMFEEMRRQEAMRRPGYDRNHDRWRYDPRQRYESMREGQVARPAAGKLNGMYFDCCMGILTVDFVNSDVNILKHLSPNLMISHVSSDEHSSFNMQDMKK